MSRPNLYGVPAGVDFAAAVLDGLEARYATQPPETWGRMTLLVNSGRMARQMQAAFDCGPARLVPRILPVSDLAPLAPGADIPPAMPRLELVLHLAQLLDTLTDRQSDLAPKSAIFDLAESLTDLMDELSGEGRGIDALDHVDVAGHASHWQRSRAIVAAAYDYIAETDPRLPGAEVQRRQLADALVGQWADTPTTDPVILAGSTGSRGATRALMGAIARLPAGAVVLPGFDFDMPPDHWMALDDPLGSEDHPQYRYRVLMRDLGIEPSAIKPWNEDTAAPDPARNRLVGLALCPAPVTDRWRAAAAGLPPLAETTARLSLLNAPSPRLEANAVALRLREAVETGHRAALITPDRELTRQVASALARWGIEPDDSGGVPLHQTPPGRLLRLTASLIAEPATLSELLAILKHPLTATAGDRGVHLLATRELELDLRGAAVARPSPAVLLAFGADRDGRYAAWAEWVARLLEPKGGTSLVARISAHMALTEEVARGPGGAGSGGLWEEIAGRAALEAMQALANAAPAHSGEIAPHAYATLLNGYLGRLAVTDPRRPHPDVMIWGTLEARAGGVDLAILSGLNDGTWPDLPPPDPWMNRAMRHDAGLLLPERRIGLAAHDFQQAIAAPEVLLTRAVRDAEAETVPSRWLNRLTNLLSGLGPEGEAALEAMEARGARYRQRAEALEQPETPVAPAPRPSPRPPVEVRPRELFVTRVTTLIRDPYAIYAQYILGLRKLSPLIPAADARERGTALHEVMEAFLSTHADWQRDPDAARLALARAADAHLGRLSADAAIRALWRARLMQAADRIVADEGQRLARGRPVLEERRGALALGTPDFTLRAKPDRIDLLSDGTYAIRDYKSGTPPTARQVQAFDKQLPLEAAMASRGAFPGLPAAPVREMTYISLGVTGEDREIPMTDRDGADLPDAALDGLRRLIARYQTRAQGYTAQRAAETTRFDGDFDHLSRHGEWGLADEPEPQDVGPRP
ncbi:MAG: PD-(D/E)XK nuclease family protein [Pseudomonadota bacterium]